jgi:hypothetical protein
MGLIAHAYGILWTMPEDLRVIQKRLGADLTRFNGNRHWTVPMAAHFIIGQDGVIAYSEINPDYTKRPEVTEMLPSLEQLARRRR